MGGERIERKNKREMNKNRKIEQDTGTADGAMVGGHPEQGYCPLAHPGLLDRRRNQQEEQRLPDPDQAGAEKSQCRKNEQPPGRQGGNAAAADCQPVYDLSPIPI